MLDTILYVFLTITQSPNYVPPKDICKEDVSHLTHQNQITFQIGCSEVNGLRVYPSDVLEGIYNGKSYTY